MEIRERAILRTFENKVSDLYGKQESHAMRTLITARRYASVKKVIHFLRVGGYNWGDLYRESIFDAKHVRARAGGKYEVEVGGREYFRFDQ